MHRTSASSSSVQINFGALARPMRSWQMACGTAATYLVILAASACSFATAQTTAPNEWTWVGGSSTVTGQYGQPGVYGTLGTPATGNIPGGRDSAATWTDNNGNFWLFGGEGVDANGNFGQLNDLWEFNPLSQKWTWMGGSSTVPAGCAGSTTVPCGQPGNYGALGSTAAGNLPGGRSETSYWTDSDGNFWMFGGYGFDAGQNLGDLNDLWEFNPTTKEWTWRGGSSIVGSSGGQSGVYGTLGTVAAANIPGGRDSATMWTDKTGKFWMYGGAGFDSQGYYGELDDVWKFDPDINEWTWLGGNSTLPTGCTNVTYYSGVCGWPAVYGALGQPAPGNSPGSRAGSVGWTDSAGNFWLFGGLGNVFWEQRDFSEIDQYDLWEFNTTTNQWAWMSGNTSSICGESSSEDFCAQDGIYGAQGVPSIANIPASRDQATGWTGSDGNLWLFGGEQTETTNASGVFHCNDVWVFEPTANEWAWMSGNQGCNWVSGSYGALGIPAAANAPPVRSGAAHWKDSNGNLWIFGGAGWAEAGTCLCDLNDLWVYQPAAPAPEPSFEVIASPNPINIGAMGTGAPTITTGTTTVSIVAADGFNSPVALTATPDAMNGVTDITGSFSPATVTGSGTSTLTISVTGSAVLIASSYPLTITATSGSVSQSIDVIVDVTSIGLAAPSFSVPAGSYSTPQTVTISDASGNEFIYYTTDGSTPTASSPVYVNPITIASTTTLKAIALPYDKGQSAVTTATYTIVPTAATPAFQPADGTFSSPQSVTITDSTPGATIYYTTNGITPTTNSTVYSGAIPVSATETIEAIAVASGYMNSSVASATYTIDLPTFTFAASPTSLTVNSGSQGSTTLTVTPQNGFNSAVSFACSGLPANATCSFNPTTVTPSGTAATTQLTITVSAQASAARPGSRPFLPATGLAIASCFFIWRRRRLLGGALSVMLLLVGVGLLSGCSGGGTAGSGGGGSSPQSYTVTVTATSGTIQQTATVMLAEN